MEIKQNTIAKTGGDESLRRPGDWRFGISRLLALTVIGVFLFPHILYSAPNESGSTSGYEVTREGKIETLEDLIRFDVAHDSNCALAFQCRKVYPPLEIPPSQLQEMQRRGLTVGGVQQSATQMFYCIGVDLPGASVFARSQSPITEIGNKWDSPFTLNILTNEMCFMGLLVGAPHNVGGERFIHKNEFGISANEGFSIVRLMLRLDLANTGRPIKWVSRQEKLFFVDSESEHECQIGRDEKGRAVSISVPGEKGLIFSLSATEQGFLYELKNGTYVSLQVLFRDVYPIREPEVLFDHLWETLIPSSETIISFREGNSNVIFSANDFDFTGGHWGAPMVRSLHPTSTAASGNLLTGRLILGVIFLVGFGGLLIALFRKKNSNRTKK